MTRRGSVHRSRDTALWCLGCCAAILLLLVVLRMLLLLLLLLLLVVVNLGHFLLRLTARQRGCK